MFCLNKIKTQKGRSMVEMLGVLVIVGVLSVAGIEAFGRAMFKHRINKTTDEIVFIVTHVRTFFSSQRSYMGLSTQSAYILGLTPTEMGTDGSLNTPFGPLIIGPSLSASAGETNEKLLGFTIVLNNLPNAVCTRLASADWGSFYTSGLIGVAASGSAMNLQGVKSTLLSCSTEVGQVCSANMPMKISDAATACNCGTSHTCSFGIKHF